jgi:choice-of-anchor B domain-containing protein
MIVRLLVLVFLFVLPFCSVQGQARLDLVAHLPYDTLVNNCWGYVHPDGTEYAMVGTSSGLSVVSLADPQQPVELHRISEPYALWRDIFTFGNFAYAVADQFVSAEGVLILDLSPLPDAPIVSTWRPYLEPFTDTLNRCHNLSIDDNGILYLSGCNVNNGGIIMADVASDPWNPVFIGPAENLYSHDSHVVDNTLYSSNILDGVFSVIDVSDPFFPELLATQETPFAFTHNAWTSGDGNYLFTTDEKPNAPVASYDISDLGNIRELDTYRPLGTQGTGVLPHNVQVFDDFLVIAYYVDGCIMVDASRPGNLIEVAQYDTYPGTETGFRGAWGAYLWFPSGFIIVSDITEGLFVLDPTYERACYLEGQVSDANNGNNISGAEIRIEAPQLNTATTDLLGRYATGVATSDYYNITVEKTGYYPHIEEGLYLQNGQLQLLNVELEPLPEYSVLGSVKDEAGNPIPNAWVGLVTEDLEYKVQTNEFGMYQIDQAFLGSYNLMAGAWGYLYHQDSTFQLQENTPYDIVLQKGYEDLFEFDLGWEISGTAETGVWELARPEETLTGSGRISNPGMDSPEDLGYECFVTGNGGGSASDDDVDNGETILLSPPIDLSGFREPVIEFDYWFFNAWAATEPNDHLKIEIWSDTDGYPFLDITNSKNFWQTGMAYPLQLPPSLLTTVRLKIYVGDTPDTEHLLEAGFDNFRVYDASPFPPLAIQRDGFELDAAPNPFTDQLRVYFGLPNSEGMPELQIHSVEGRLVHSQSLEQESGKLDLNLFFLPPGAYFITLLSDGRRSPAKKVVKAAP